MMGRTKTLLDRSFSRLSSGASVTSARDNQAHFNAGLRASTKVQSTNYAVRNIASGVSLVQTAESSTRELQTNVQRIRELAVQSANGTLTNDVRFSLQVEVDALVEEINMQAESANEGGIKLLDGSAKSLNFMVGTEGGNVIRLDLQSLKSKDLGKMVREAGFDVDSGLGLLSGDIEINGVSIRGTALTDDLLSTADRTGSALAKVHAINASEHFTNVRADVLETLVLGDAIVGGQLDQANNFTLNGVRITDTLVQSGDASGTLVGAINSVYYKTGVLAEVDDIGALTLIADDGRNIEIETSSNFAASATGLNSGFGDTVVTGGAIQLVSNDQIELEINTLGMDAAIGHGTGLGMNYIAFTPDTYLETVSITSQEEARRTIDITDGALDTLRKQVSSMGAMSSRLEYAMQTITTEQVAAQQTKSTMLDVDFAKEVVELTRQTLSQQTQSAVMAQANTSGDSALTLLDGMASLGFGGKSFGTGVFASSFQSSIGANSGFSLFS
jgi:flagellin